MIAAVFALKAEVDVMTARKKAIEANKYKHHAPGARYSSAHRSASDAKLKADRQQLEEQVAVLQKKLYEVFESANFNVNSMIDQLITMRNSSSPSATTLNDGSNKSTLAFGSKQRRSRRESQLESTVSSSLSSRPHVSVSFMPVGILKNNNKNTVNMTEAQFLTSGDEESQHASSKQQKAKAKPESVHAAGPAKKTSSVVDMQQRRGLHSDSAPPPDLASSGADHASHNNDRPPSRTAMSMTANDDIITAEQRQAAEELIRKGGNGPAAFEKKLGIPREAAKRLYNTLRKKISTMNKNNKREEEVACADDNNNDDDEADKYVSRQQQKKPSKRSRPSTSASSSRSRTSTHNLAEIRTTNHRKQQKQSDAAVITSPAARQAGRQQPVAAESSKTKSVASEKPNVLLPPPLSPPKKASARKPKTVIAAFTRNKIDAVIPSTADRNGNHNKKVAIPSDSDNGSTKHKVAGETIDAASVSDSDLWRDEKQPQQIPHEALQQPQQPEMEPIAKQLLNAVANSNAAAAAGLDQLQSSDDVFGVAIPTSPSGIDEAAAPFEPRKQPKSGGGGTARRGGKQQRK